MGSEPVAATAATLDIDLPGPRSPVLLQTLQWLTQPSLRWTLRLGAQFGDTFRLRVLGPRHSSDRTRRPMVPRTVVVLSRPAHLREVFARSRDELRSGEAREFIAWHMGDDAVAVLDGAPHRAERQVLHSVLCWTARPHYEDRLRGALASAFAAWPDQGTIPLAPMVERAGIDAILTCLFGRLDPYRLARVRHLIHAGAVTTTVPPQALVLPILQRDLGGWSLGGRLRRAVAEFNQFVEQQLDAPRSHRDDSGLMLEALQDLESGPLSQATPGALVAQRVRTLLAGWQPTATAAVWLCFRVLRDPLLRERAYAAVTSDPDLEGKAYLEAACKETLRLNLPFVGAFRRVARPTTFGGITCQTGTLILPTVPLTHRRPELYPEPERFRPERFLERSFGFGEYAPFGGGIRHCLGEQFALLQMRILLTELLRAFHLRPAGRWSDAERRQHTMLVMKDPLRTIIRRWRAPAPMRIEA